MKFQTFETAQASYKKTVGLSKFVILIMLLCFMVSNLFLGFLLYQAQKNVVVLDKNGHMYGTESSDMADMRKYIYEDYVKTFYTTWYSFNENNYDEHIEKGLKMIGETGKELFNEYNDLQLKSNIIQKNLRYEVKITKVEVDMNTKPISGRIEGIQTCIRAQGTKSRTMYVNFTIGDITASKENLQGCQIGEWKVYHSSEIGQQADSLSTQSPEAAPVTATN